MRKWKSKTKNHGYNSKAGKIKSIDELILSRQWKSVKNWLFDKKIDKCQLMKKISIGEPSLLHSLCTVHPPISLVVKIVDLCPQLVLQKDDLGRLPLHIAAGWGASPQVVGFLLVMNIDAASTLDLSGKTPLIWAFENMKSPRRCCADNDVILADKGCPFGNKVPGPFEDVVQALVDAALEVVSSEDNSGKSAIDYAIENECNANSLRILQIATARDNQIRKEMKKTSYFKIRKLHIHSDESLFKFHPTLDERKLRRQSTCRRMKSFLKDDNQSEDLILRDKELMDFLGVSNAQSHLDISLEFLNVNKIDALKAAQQGFKTSKLKRKVGIPPIVLVEYGIRDDVSEVS